MSTNPTANDRHHSNASSVDHRSPSSPHRFKVVGAEEPSAELVERTRIEIQTLAREIRQLARADISWRDFSEGFLTRIISAFAAVGGAIPVAGQCM